MTAFDLWTRRRFLLSTAATAAFAARPDWGQAVQSAATSPEEIAGSIRALLRGHTARPLRYRPVDNGFAIRNGSEFFNRPLYGPNNAFRVDCGDLPEFSLYLPGHGGNLRLGIAQGAQAKWLSSAAQIDATYRAGRMIYRIADPLLGSAQLTVEAVTLGQGSGLILRVRASQLPDEPEIRLIWAFGGVSGRKGKRGGDIGCESEPVSQFFQVRPQECAGNNYTLAGNTARLHSTAADLQLTFPTSASLQLSDGARWNEPWQQLLHASDTTSLPILIGSAPLLGKQSTEDALYLCIEREPAASTRADLAAIVSARCTELDALAARLKLHTSDPFVDALGGALAVAGDALWDNAQHCVMHGAVAWRMPLAGWRGPYVLDALGWHERLREHARHWIARQNQSPVTTAIPALGGPDPTSHLARSESMLHSSGDLSHNHYDMNLVFFDAVLRHLQWTGDVDFAREIWPAFKLHLAWEQRLFRRVYAAPSGRQLQLYEAYACIWASDNLQYNGGGAAHSSAYNLFAHRQAAALARLLGEDSAPFEAESAAILAGMRELLWLPSQGAFAESKDLMQPQTVYTSPALWTVYHSIDSRVPTPREAWQMAAERLAALPAVPVEGEGVPPGGVMLSCSDWLPYEWSLNLLLLAENMHMALALWQAGMADEAFSLFKGSLLDSLYQGLTPGNFHMTSQLDDHRQEAQRDFGDPIGITSRALVEGLFGLTPDLLANQLLLRPGFPAHWTEASLQHPDFDLAWQRNGDHETLSFTPRFAKPATLQLALRAPRTGLPIVRVNGIAQRATFDAEAVGSPVLLIEAPPATHWSIEVHWQGERADAPPAPQSCAIGDRVLGDDALASIDDPQGCLHHGRAALAGHHTVFVHRHREACSWWLPIALNIQATPAPATHIDVAGRMEPLDLSSHLTHRITDIFNRTYAAPRSLFCSLSIPSNGIGGWATFDRHPLIDDSGLRALGGELRIPSGITFRTPAGNTAANCRFLSHWQQDAPALSVPLSGSARSCAVLLAGTTFPQCSRMVHATLRVQYTDGTHAELQLRNPENWWPIEQDYLIDDYLFVDTAAPPARVDLATGTVRVLDLDSFKGRGRTVPGGAASVITFALDPGKTLAELTIHVELYGIVFALLAATLVR